MDADLEQVDKGQEEHPFDSHQLLEQHGSLSNPCLPLVRWFVPGQEHRSSWRLPAWRSCGCCCARCFLRSRSCWRVCNCTGHLVQMLWSGFVILSAELQQLQTCTSFQTVPWYGLVHGQSCASVLLGWWELEMGSPQRCGSPLALGLGGLWDSVVLQVPGGGSICGE